MKYTIRRSSLASLILLWSAAPVLAACAGSPDPGSTSSSASVPVTTPVQAGALEQTLLLQDPTISAKHVVFRYAEDLWVASRAGGLARRLTSSPGTESSPQLSPDGSMVAFTGQYEGNSDVYVIPVTGGVPKRLTWHPGSDGVLEWTPDGGSVLFRSSRIGYRVSQIYMVPLNGGTPKALELPKVSHASMNDAGTHIAYTAIGDAFRTWKRYRGGRLTSVWIFDRATHEVEVVPRIPANDTFPRWLGGDVYFASDRDDVMNLYRFTPGGSDVEQLTKYTDYHIRSMDSGGGAVVFEQAGALHVFDPASGSIEDLAISVPSDGLTAVPRWQPVEGQVRGAAIAPNGKRAVFEARGEIITVPKEHGDARNLTRSPGVHERSPAWSPDGEEIAWFSDEGGEYRLVVSDRMGREEPRVFELGGAGFYYDLQWSPDGEKLMFSDKANKLNYLMLESGEITEVADVQGSLGVLRPTAVWSHDSKWIAFQNRNTRTLYDQIALYELATKTTTTVTDDFAMSGDPAFSTDGKYLYFTASIDQGPGLMGLNMTTSSTPNASTNLYVAVLQADEPNPLFPKSDDAVDEKKKKDEEDADSEEENGEEEEGADESPEEETAEEGEGEEEDEEEEDEEEEGPAIDLEGLDQRILALPVASSRYGNLACAGDKLLFLEMGSGGGRRRGGGGATLKSFDFDSREAKELKKGIRGFSVSADGKSLLTSSGGSFSITDAKGGDGKTLGIDSVRVRVEPELEWPQILREVWRIERDYFYDEQFHGVDWPAMWERWKVFLPHVKHRADLTMMIQELIGELCCGHNYVGGGDRPGAPAGISVGLLGADFEVTGGRFRIARILRGQNWNPTLRAPLTEPGVDAAEGDYLIAVNGQDLTAADNLYQAFEYTAGKQTDLTLSVNADGSEARTVTVVPTSSEGQLRFRTWIEDNRKRVEELSGGRLAYVYMPDTGGRGRAFFNRDFFSQLDKEGVVLDERYNGGGQVADYVIELLSRDVMSYWMNREKWLGYSPSGVMTGPKVMIINENAGSGGDWMPWAFKKFGVGPLVGPRTWGGLVGISGYPPLIDGGMVTAASFGIMDTDGTWAVENVGVAPDHEVIEWPADIIAGKDPQLEKAVELALEALATQEKKPLPTYHPPSKR